MRRDPDPNRAGNPAWGSANGAANSPHQCGRSVPMATIKLAKPQQPLDGPCDTEGDTAVTKQTKVTPG